MLQADAELRAAMGPELHDAYLAHKHFEVGLMAELSDAEQCARYYLAY